MLEFQTMTFEDFDSYLNRAIKKYTNELVSSGAYKKKEAVQLASQQFCQLLPHGLGTSGQFLFQVEEHGKKIGIVWYGLTEQDEGFIYDFIILEPYQGMGYGTKTMKLLERHAKQNGIKKLALHVFGHNLSAVALYKKMGYVPYSMHMHKEL